ncbi:M56 family metallopeptidase, partial [Alistipes putredinis]
MPTFLLYSLKAAGCLAVFYLFYKLLLSRDTLHRMNRVLLCGVLLLSFLLPLCVITVEKELPGVSAAGIDVIPENYFRRDMVFENRIPDDTRDLMIIEEPEPAPEPFDWGVLLGIIYFAGMFATLGWTVCNIVRVVRMTRRGRRIPLGNGSVLVLSDRIRAPFSWMRYVVMSEEDYACGGGTILVHEQAHQRLGHSWDLLLVDLLGCLQWFNPAMWLLRVELRAVHEYEADEQVLRCGVDAKDYQMLLIKKAVGGRWYSIANSLNHSNLKNRITMMLRKRSSRWARAKALYVLPLACLALGTFAQTSYVLPEDKTTKNSGNGEMPLPAGADDRMVGTPEGGMPPVEGSMAELLANLERTALEKQTAESGAHTFTGRVFGRDDKPWAGYEFICSGGRRVVTDAEGRFTIVSEKPIVCYLVGGETDRKVKSVGSRFGIPMETDIALEFHLKESLALTHLPVSDEPVVYAVYGDPADFRFDPKHPPLIMDGGEELSAETLDTYLGLPEQKMIGAWMVKGPEAVEGYGTRAANGVLSIGVQIYPYTQSWKPADPSLWDPEDLELYLVWEGDELPEQFVARRDAYMKEEFAKLLTADAGKLERLGYKSVDGAEEWVTVEVSDGAALIPFWIDLSDEG